jgi:UDP-N-acetylglucosamine transferase subunit ALG13
MILVTVGTQLPFPRFVSAIDSWNYKSKKTIFAQVGEDDNKYHNMNYVKFLPIEEFDQIISETTVIVSHAGMGSILTALKYNKPIILFPRNALLGEHRNDHQLATLRAFQNTPGVYVAFDESGLFDLLDKIDFLEPSVLCESSEYRRLGAFIDHITGV